jgi:hypothetical protein
MFGASKSTGMHRMQCIESGNYFEVIAHIPCTLAYKVPLISRPKNIIINCRNSSNLICLLEKVGVTFIDSAFFFLTSV